MVEPHSIAKLLSEPSLLADPCSITTMMDGTALHSESLDWSAPVVSGLNLEHICLRSRESGRWSDGVEVPRDSFGRDGSSSSSRHCLLTVWAHERMDAVNWQSSSVLAKNGKHGSFLDKAPHAPK